jgi:hypothetical protein
VKTGSKQNVSHQLATLSGMGVAALRQKYLEVFGEPSRSGNKAYLFKKLAWRIQSLAEGGLSERARRRAEELARDADVRTTVPRPPKATADTGARTVVLAAPSSDGRDRLPIPGTVLTRTYRGKHVAVTVLTDGFEFEGQIYKSLSASGRSPRPRSNSTPWKARSSTARRSPPRWRRSRRCGSSCRPRNKHA